MILEQDSFIADDFETSYASAQEGNAEAQSSLALCYYEGEGTEQNVKEAVSWWQKAAAQNYPAAQYWLGNCFYYGQGVTKDMNMAAKYWIKASEQGNIEAKYNLGICYLYGKGVAKNTDQALSLWTTAAESGYLEAQLSLGKIYAEGLNGVGKSQRKAFTYYKQAGEQGDAEASFWIAQHLRGENYIEACSWLKKAAEAGLAEAQFEFGAVLTSEAKETPQSIERLLEIIQWWRLAAEQGNANAQYGLSLLAFMDGFPPDVPLTREEALEFCKKAAAQGHSDAILQLAVGKLEGAYGLEKKPKEGLREIKAFAEDKHYPPAIYQLGLCYLHGQGCKKKLQKAFECFKEAAEYNHTSAKLQLAFCYELGLGTEVDLEKAIENYTAAAESEDEDALFHLALCYMTGLEVAKNLKKAKKLLHKAAGFGQENASFILENWDKACTFDAKLDILNWLDCDNGETEEASQLDLESLEAMKYITGSEGYELNPQKGIDILRKALKKGSAIAARTLGLLYLEGDILPQNFDKATELLVQAADKGDIRAKIELAWLTILLEDKEVFESSISMLTAFHNSGYREATYYLGYCYFTGSGVKQNYKKALSLLEKVKDDFPKAVYCIAVAYKEGLGVKPNPQKAFAIAKSAYEKGNKEILYFLPSLYAEGVGTKKNLAKARALYEEAVLITPPNARIQHILGYMLFSGEGGPVDYPRAIKLWEESAKAGIAESQNALGQCYLRGLAGLKVDQNRAIKFLKKAAKQQNPNAIKALKELKEKK